MRRNCEKQAAETAERVALFERWRAAGSPELYGSIGREHIAKLRHTMQKEHPDRGGDRTKFEAANKEFRRLKRGKTKKTS